MSRLRPPRLLLEVVRRDSLLKELSAATAPLVVISAPGGFGKTVTLSQWAESDRRPFAWLQADEADNDPMVLLQYLTAALDPVLEIDPMVAEWLQFAPPPVERRILPALALSVQSAEPLVFVIDDAHLLRSEPCWQFLGLLLEHLPDGSHLCISGRSEPPLPLARLRSAGRLLELGPAELALSPAEARELLRLHGVEVDLATATYLHGVNEGWAAGLYLTVLAREGTDEADWLADVRGHQRNVADYLASEVLGRAPSDVAEFLLQTSILERLSPGLCRAVTGDARAGELLRGVARDNLFIAALDDTGEWFRYHHLMTEFLLAELMRRDDSEVADLHRRAAAWFEEHDQLEEAVRHWLAAGEPGRAGSIVCRALADYVRCSRYHTLRRWVEMFTDEQIIGDKALVLAAAVIGPMAGESPRVRRWMSTALHEDVGDGLWPGSGFPLRLMQLAVRANFAPDGVTGMRRDAVLAIELSDGVASPARAATTVQLGIATWLSGQSEAALDALRDAGAEGEVSNVLAQIAAIGFTALVLADLGRWEEAAERVAAGSQRVEEMGLDWGLPTLPVLLAQARLLAHDGESTAAARLAETIAGVVEGGLPAFLALISEVLLGEFLAEIGDLPEATRWMRAGSRLLATWPDAGILRERLARLEKVIEQRRLLEPLTPAERRVLELLPTELSLKQIAPRLSVSRETVRTHVGDIYRKLEVHSRTDAVARARELGLIG